MFPLVDIGEDVMGRKNGDVVRVAKDLQTEITQYAVSIAIRIRPRGMSRAVEFDDKTQFVTVEISDDKGLASFEIVKQRMLPVKFQTMIPSVTQHVPHGPFGRRLSFPQLTAPHLCDILQFPKQKQTHDGSLLMSIDPSSPLTYSHSHSSGRSTRPQRTGVRRMNSRAARESDVVRR